MQPFNDQYDYQHELEQLRQRYHFDFAGIALPDDNQIPMIIKWRYVSGNHNTRYRRIVLRKGHGIAGMVMKTGKSIQINNFEDSPFNEHIINYPIAMHESLTALVAMPLWEKHSVRGVLLFGQREGRPLPEQHNLDYIAEPVGRYTTQCEVLR